MQFTPKLYVPVTAILLMIEKHFWTFHWTYELQMNITWNSWSKTTLLSKRIFQVAIKISYTAQKYDIRGRSHILCVSKIFFLGGVKAVAKPTTPVLRPQEQKKSLNPFRTFLLLHNVNKILHLKLEVRYEGIKRDNHVKMPHLNSNKKCCKTLQKMLVQKF